MSPVLLFIIQSLIGTITVAGLRRLGPKKWDSWKKRGDEWAANMTEIGVPGGEKIAGLLRPTTIAAMLTTLVVTVFQNKLGGADWVTALQAAGPVVLGAVGMRQVMKTRTPAAMVSRPVSLITDPPVVTTPIGNKEDPA